MKTVFRIYENEDANFESSIFDMISGDKETKQTKGLAYVMKENPYIIKNILMIDTIKNHLEKIRMPINWKKVSKIEVIAEKITASSKRVDILIKIDKENKPFIALIIEAKSIKSKIRPIVVYNQIQEYIGEGELPDCEEYEKLPIILTNYKTIITNEIVSIRWEEIINIIGEQVNNNNYILLQYYNFITGVNKDMHFYEKEVLSIPAGKTINLVEKHLIYECPDKEEYRYKKPIFITFRDKGGGVMRKLYKIEDILVFNPTINSDIDRVNDYLKDARIKNRLKNYIYDSIYEDSEEKRFYILSAEEIIQLNNMPKPERNNAKFTYYRLFDILTKNIVKPASRFN